MPDTRTPQDIAADYQAARDANDASAMRRFQNEEACLVLLTMLGRMASNPKSFVHGVALKGGMLMAGELRSPRASADIDFTSGHLKRVDPEEVLREVELAGRQFRVRQEGEPERTPGGEVIHLQFESLTDGGSAKIEISIREDLVFAVRDATFNVTDIGIDPFSIPALAEVELVSEKIRALVQRAQPRDLFDLRLYLCESGWHLDPKDLAKAVDVKLQTGTRHKRWKADLWRANLDEISKNWESTVKEWVAPEHIPTFETAVGDVARRLKALQLS